MSVDEEREKRRAARANWPGWKGTLAEMPPEPDLSDSTTAEERLLLLRELSLRGWLLTGRSIPDYDRSTMPTRIIRPRDS